MKEALQLCSQREAFKGSCERQTYLLFLYKFLQNDFTQKLRSIIHLALNYELTLNPRF